MATLRSRQHTGLCPDAYITEWEDQLLKRSEQLAERIGLEICSWTGRDRRYNVSASLKAGSLPYIPDSNTRVTISIALRLSLTCPEDPVSSFEMDPPPLRLFSRRAVWDEAVRDLSPYFERQAIPEGVAQKIQNLLKANPPTASASAPSDQVTNCHFRIGADFGPGWKGGQLCECTGTLRVTGTANTADGKTDNVGPLTMFFDTESFTVYEMAKDLFPSLTPLQSVEDADQRRESTTDAVSLPARMSSPRAGWHQAIKTLQDALGNYNVHYSTLTRLVETLQSYQAAVKTVIPDDKAVDWRFRVDTSRSRLERYKEGRAGPYHLRGQLRVTGGVESTLGSIVSIKAVMLAFDTAHAEVEQLEDSSS